MKSRYVLSPEAVEDLASIWHYIQTQSSVEMANRVESVIRERIAFLARNPGAGHQRRDLTDLRVGALFAAAAADDPRRVAAQGERFVAGKNVEVQFGDACDLRRKTGAAHRD